MEEKYQKLKEILAQMGRVVLAFSGGVDSTFLLRVAQEVLGYQVLAVTVFSEVISQEEKEGVEEIALELEAKLVILETSLLGQEEFLHNPPDRCYHCKKRIFTLLQDFAQEEGITWIIDGSNADDLADYRPGQKALKEMGIRSPLLEVGLTKEEIRLLSKKLDLPTWNKPALACLASRIPYGSPITQEKLKEVEKGETFLHGLGLGQLRVRHHGEMVRLEVLPEEIAMVLEKKEKIISFFKKLGFLYVTLDLVGYRTGSLNEGLEK